MIYLNQSIVLLFQKYKNFQENVQVDSVIDHNNNISKYNPLVSCSCIKLTKEWNNPKNGFYIFKILKIMNTLNRF